MSMEETYSAIIEGLELPISYLFNPEKRIYGLYMVSSALLAYYIYYRTRRKGSFISYLLNKKVWLSKSAVVDYIMIFFNGIVKMLLIGPYLVYGLYIAFYINEYLLRQFGFPASGLGVTETLALYTISLTIVSDFAGFFSHYLMHRIPFLWEFHKVHHSATTLNPITQYRIHPVELIINNIRGICITGVLMGIFDYLSDHQVSKVLFLGVNVFSFVFLFFGSNLRHSHVRLRYPTFMEHLFISPLQHQAHHSTNPIHFNKNMGSKLAIWDWAFGTLILSKNIGKLSFGLDEEDRDFDSFWKNLYTPFKNIAIKSFGWVKRC